jgi:hypothetical protein
MQELPTLKDKANDIGVIHEDWVIDDLAISP